MAICKRMSHVLFTDRRVYVRPPSPDKVTVMVVQYPHGADGCKDILSDDGIEHYMPYRQHDDKTPHSSRENDRFWSLAFLNLAMSGVRIPKTETTVETHVQGGVRTLHRVEFKPVLAEEEVYVMDAMQESENTKG